ncbi:MAG: SurA N-terminal domain-containing protein [Desulfobacterales bacterium]
MLSLMRKNAGSWIIKFILGAVILAFIPFGYGIYQDRRDVKIATVNGDPVRFEEFNRQYNNLVEQVRRNFGGSLNEETIKGLRLKEQALNQLIDQKLMLAEAANLGISVSDQELAESIAKIEAFQTAGVFDPKRYEYVLSRLHLTQDAFEADQKHAMLVDKLSKFVTSNVKVSDAETLDWYKWNNASVDLRFVKFPANHYQDINPTEDEVKSFFEAHKENYKTDVELKARYVLVDPKTYADRVSLTEEELRTYYDNNKDEFYTPKTVEARHILIKVDPQAGEKSVEEARQKALEVLKLAREGRDFAELAKKYSEGPTAANGGYLGAFRKDAMVKPFADQAFAMKAGDISEPVQTRFGWHIIKVEKVNEATTTSFEAARDDIRRKLTDERAKALAYETAESIYDNSFQGDDLVRNAADQHLAIAETGFFTQKGPVNGIKDGAKFAAAAFALSVNDISPIQELSDGYVILQVTDKKDSQVPELQNVVPRVRADLIKEKQNEKARAEAEAFLAALQAGKSFDDESARTGLPVDTTGFFTRKTPVPKIGNNPELSDAAFLLSPQNRWPQKVFEGNNAYYVVEFDGRKEPSAEDFKNDKADVKEKLREQKQYRAVTDWLAELRNGGEITINNSYLN